MGRIVNWWEWLAGEEGLLEFFEANEVNKEVLPLQNPVVQRSLLVEDSKSSFCRGFKETERYELSYLFL
jgi:hypothetical protein